MDRRRLVPHEGRRPLDAAHQAKGWRRSLARPSKSDTFEKLALGTKWSFCARAWTRQSAHQSPATCLPSPLTAPRP